MPIPYFQVAEDKPTFGEQFGSGISQGLQYLLQNKLASMQAEKSIPGLKALMPNLSDEQLKSIAMTDPSIQKEIIKRQMQAPQEAAYLEALQGIIGNAPSTTTSMPMEQTFNTSEIPTKPLISKPGITSQQATKLAELAQKGESLKLRRELGEKKLERDKQKEINKEILPFKTEVRKKYAAAEEMKPVIDRMKELEKKGDLEGGLKLLFLDLAGISHPELALNPNSQEFIKLRAFFGKYLRDQFGGRLSRYMLDAYMAQFPSLYNTKEGREQIYKDLNFSYESSKLEHDIMNKLEQKYGEKQPRDFQSQVMGKYAKKRDKIYNKIYNSTNNKTVNSIDEARQRGATKIRDLETGEIIIL